MRKERVRKVSADPAERLFRSLRNLKEEIAREKEEARRLVRRLLDEAAKRGEVFVRAR